MRDGVRHTVRESLDFTLKGNRAERVQTVNVVIERGGWPEWRQGFSPIGLFQAFGLLDDVFDIDPAQRRGKTPLGFGQCRPHHVGHQRG